MSSTVTTIVKVLAVVLAAGGIGVALAVAAALLGHEVLVALYGQDLAPIDDTPPMIVAVWTSYAIGAASALVVLVVGWRRFVRD